MAMKQTQTKMFDFSDVGLDFCVASKALFPDRVKKMLALGYNTQTVSSVTVSGNQVTFTYGVSHGYAAGRVLKISTGDLSPINNGEFVIDSVTSNTLKLTIDNAPASISGGFNTYVAPLGWELVFEQTYIHVYKFKALDETDLYIRLCFQNQMARRNCISPCIGTTYNTTTGAITDTNSLAVNRSITSPGNGFKWELSYSAENTFNNSSYTDGLSSHGKALVIGSKYHFLLAYSTYASPGFGRVSGFSPVTTLNYSKLKYPVLLGETYGDITAYGSPYGLNYAKAYIGVFEVLFSKNFIFDFPQSSSSFLPSSLDTFNTTAANGCSIYEATSKQIIGHINGGIYIASYGETNTPSLEPLISPVQTTEIDFSNIVYIHNISISPGAQQSVFFAIPVEEIKIGY